jgi:hypothetical protein
MSLPLATAAVVTATTTTNATTTTTATDLATVTVTLESTGEVAAMVIACIEQKIRRMGHQRGKLGSWQCGPVGRHMLTTL